MTASVADVTSLPTLAVVIPATDHPATLDRCRAAIACAADGPDEVIVVDGPTDLSVCEARNLGVERSCSDVVVFVDSDVEVHPDVFTRFRAAFAVDPDLAAVHGSYDAHPADRGTVSVFRNLLHHHVHQTNAGPTETFWTGLGAVRRDAFAAVGGFDADRYPHPSIEDIELGRRLWASGHAMHLDPSIQGTHLKRWGLWSMVRTDLTRRGVPWLVLQFQHRRVSTALNCGWRHRVGALGSAVAVVALVLGSPAIAAVGLLALLAADRAFHRLLVRELGVVRGVVGIGLHAVHHLVAVASVPIALVAVLTTERPRVPDVGRTRAAARELDGVEAW